MAVYYRLLDEENKNRITMTDKFNQYAYDATKNDWKMDNTLLAKYYTQSSRFFGKIEKITEEDAFEYIKKIKENT